MTGQVLLCAVVTLIAGLGTALAQSAPGTTAPYQTTGPYKVVMETVPTLPEHVVYRPENLKAVKGKMPVVAFANGGCSPAGNAFEFYLREVASYGLLVSANGVIDPAPMPAGRPPKPVPAAEPGGRGDGAGARGSGGRGDGAGRGTWVNTKTSQLLETMDWAKAQSTDKSSPFHGKIDPEAIAVMGQSCGGIQAVEAAADPRVKTALILNSGPGMIPPVQLAQFGLSTKEDLLSGFHTPVIYIVGGERDIAFKAASSNFEQIQKAPLFWVSMNTGHNGTLWEPHGGKFAEIATQWVLWQLKKDKKAAAKFEGPSCGYCSDPELKVQRKGIK
jgi:hypothetical protein